MSTLDSPIPIGYCQCGCGQQTPRATRTRPEQGLTKGSPTRYVPGHQSRTRKFKIEEPNPTGCCMCGCGLPTQLAAMTDEAEGLVVGKPVRYLPGHHLRKSPVDYLIDPATGCWVWQGGTAGRGYGTAWVNGRQVYAHRLAYEREHGPIPEGMQVCHRCDNPPCCNPEHLFLGTATDNMRDCYLKDRNIRGEQHALTSLSRQDAEDIRASYAAGCETQDEIAARYGIAQVTVSRIVHHRTFKD